LTPKGRDALDAIRGRLQELYWEVMVKERKERKR